MTGFYFYQEPRQAIVNGLAAHLERPILDYKERSASKSWPAHIVVYRAGVSEGDYLRVTGNEKAAFMMVFEELTKKHPDFRAPGLTMLIASKNNMRMYPTNVRPGANRPADLNVKPGTAIFTDIVSPVHEQFALVGQTALLVCLSCHCDVLYSTS